MAKTPFSSKIKTRPKSSDAFAEICATPGLLVAYANKGSMRQNRVRITTPFIVGRDERCDLFIADNLVSREHLKIHAKEGGYLLEDLGSSNGTYVSGFRVTQKQKIVNSDVIRVGDAILVFQDDIDPTLATHPSEHPQFVGDFHAASILKDLNTANITGQHLLITAPSGSGKELLVQALITTLKRAKKETPYVTHNMARFTSEAEIVSTLFGVSSGVFSGVDARTGLIEQADGGVLFLDEVHNLPERAQRSLLKIVEDGEFSRIGESKKRRVNVRFVFASNAAPPNFGLAHDLLARLFVIKIPSLKERLADIPSIFDHLLHQTFNRLNLDAKPVKELLDADHYEALCLDGFIEDNVRGIDMFINKLAAKIAAGDQLKPTLAKVFSERFATGPVAKRYKSAANVKPQTNPNSNYEKNKQTIIETYENCQGNITATQKRLSELGIQTTRRWLTVFLENWGVRKGRSSK